jgi:Fe-S cluster biogenesis protein NfuA
MRVWEGSALLLDCDEVMSALESVRNLIRPDGGDFELVEVDDLAGVVRLRLVLRDAACAECVMPKAHLEAVALSMMQKRLSNLDAVSVEDPRDTRAVQED